MQIDDTYVVQTLTVYNLPGRMTLLDSERHNSPTTPFIILADSISQFTIHLQLLKSQF